MITLEKVLGIHDTLSLVGQCGEGIRDMNLLNSAVDGQAWYGTAFEQYCHTSYCINSYHVFVDGNKRTAFIVLKRLEEYGFLFDDDRLCSTILYFAEYSGALSKEDFFAEVKRCLIDTP